MAYRHGIFSEEQATSITPPIQIDGNSGLCVVFGTSPSHLASSPAKTNTPILCYNYQEAVTQLGYSEDFDKYTLCEAMSAFFALYYVAPVVFINLLNPDKHYKEVETTAEGIGATPANLGTEALIDTIEITSGADVDPTVLVNDTDYSVVKETVDGEGEDDPSTTTVTFSILSVDNITDDTITLSYKTSRDTDTEVISARTVEVGTTIELDSDTVLSTVKVISGGSEKQYLEVDVDYNAARNSDSEVVITLITDTKVVDDTIAIKYHEVDPSKVSTYDVIGGIDVATGEPTGLELAEYVYPRLGVLPGILIAPKYSTNSLVAAVLKAKAGNINEVFKATAIVDIDTEEAASYTQASEVKSTKNLSNTALFVCYPKVALDGVQYHLSTQMAALMNQVDADNKSIPYVSPSNHNLQCDSTVRKDGSEIYLGLSQANYLNGQGIITALNFAGGFRLWGSRTSIYPNFADPKDAWIPIRRIFNYVSNSLVINFWSRIDNPMNRRLIETIMTSANIWLDSLTAAGALLGARVEFLETDNIVTDLMSGILRFRLYLTPPPPAEQIIFVEEYDLNYFSALFE